MMNRDAYGKELAVALEAAQQAGRLLLRSYGDTTHTRKAVSEDPLTQADLESDRCIQDVLGRAFPGDALLSEESVSAPSRLTNRRVWIIDPMDGTREFVGRIPEFAVSIGLVEDGVPVVGVILNPAAGVGMWATRGGGTYRAKWTPEGPWGAAVRVRISSRDRLEEAVVMASRTEINKGQFRPFLGWFGELRAVGSIAWKLGCIASGEGDLNVSLAPKNEWDVCAGDLLVREAGGVYQSLEGKTRRYNLADPLIPDAMVAGPSVLVTDFSRKLLALPLGK